MHWIKRTAGCIAIVGLVIPGCAAEHASAIDESENGLVFTGPVPESSADPNDPFGACIHRDEAAIFSSCTVPEAGCTAWITREECDDDSCEIAQSFEYCEHQCETDADCPVPLTGEAAPACLGSCMLPCDEDTSCPDGFACVPVPQGGYGGLSHGSLCVQFIEYSPYIFDEHYY